MEKETLDLDLVHINNPSIWDGVGVLRQQVQEVKVSLVYITRLLT